MIVVVVVVVIVVVVAVVSHFINGHFSFTDLRVGHISLEKKKKKRDVISKFHWYIRNTAQKNHVKIRDY